jgi:hypothetical protein
VAKFGQLRVPLWQASRRPDDRRVEFLPSGKYFDLKGRLAAGWLTFTIPPLDRR